MSFAPLSNDRIRSLAIEAFVFWSVLFSFIYPVHAQPQIGEKAPSFITSTLEGQRIALKDYWEQKGSKAVVLSFFATWCKPCKEDLKYLQKIQDQQSLLGLQVLCILTQDSAKEDAVRKFMEELNVKLPVFFDEYGIIAKRYGVIALPTNFVIDNQGLLKAKYLGYSEAVKKDFEGRLKGLLSTP